MSLRVRAQGAPLDLRLLALLASHHNLDWTCVLSPASENADMDYAEFAFLERQYGLPRSLPALQPLKTDWENVPKCTDIARYVGGAILTTTPKPKTLRLQTLTTATETWVSLHCVEDSESLPKTEITSQMMANVVNDDKIAQIHLRSSAIFIEVTNDLSSGNRKRKVNSLLGDSPKSQKRHRTLKT